jgi:hypothetical protein
MIMKRFFNRLSIVAFVGLLGFGLVSDVAAQRPNSREVRDLVRSLNAKVEDLGYNLTYQMRSSSQSRQTVEDARTGVDDLTNAIKTFEDNLNLHRENRNDVQDIVSSAQNLNSMVLGTGQNRVIENGWNDVRNLIDRLAGNYGVTPNWNERGTNSSSRNNFPTNNDDDDYPSVSTASNVGLTGTYDIDTSRSESVADAMSGVQVNGAQRQDLQAKLEAPQQLAISIRGNLVTLGSSKGSPITFTADGREKTEQVDGRTVRVKATLRGDELTVSSLGGETDYTVTFSLQDSGRSLKVTRRITTDYLNETVFADSVYTKSDAVARLGIENLNLPDDGYSSNDPNDRTVNRTGSNSPNPTLSQPRIGQFIVPNGTVITGVLDNEINTKVSQNNDRFKMTVQEPMEYRGAVVEGYVSGVGRSGQVSGRSNVTFNFERITLRDGKVYDFSGNVQAIKDTNGKEVKVDNEGTAKGDSQTKETAKRGGIGAGLGALIGAIAGGGKGAVLGAIIGGGAGAGSVAIMGRDDVRLLPGSTISILSSSPIREGGRQDN